MITPLKMGMAVTGIAGLGIGAAAGIATSNKFDKLPPTGGDPGYEKALLGGGGALGVAGLGVAPLAVTRHPAAMIGAAALVGVGIGMAGGLALESAGVLDRTQRGQGETHVIKAELVSGTFNRASDDDVGDAVNSSSSGSAGSSEDSGNSSEMSESSGY